MRLPPLPLLLTPLLVSSLLACGAPREERPAELGSGPTVTETADLPDAPAVPVAEVEEHPASAAIPDLDARLDRLTASLQAELEQLHIPGAGFALVHDGEILLARGFGVADVDTGRAVDEETLFAVGSTTKAFTSTLIAMLVDEGKLAWDEPLASYLPEYDPKVQSDDPAARLTLRDALSHRSGFSRNDVLWASGLAPRDAILLAATRAEPMAPLRAEFHYNNVMYVAAGEAAARVAGQSWDELVRARILTPLGMDSTSTSVDDAALDPRMALGYLWNEEHGHFERQPLRDVDSVGPAGSLHSSTRDMAQWLRLLLGRGVFAGERLVSESALEETWKRAIEIGGGTSYGLGWFVRDRRGQRELEHVGNIDGFAAEVALLPESKLGFALLLNVSASPLQETSRELVWRTLLDPAPAAAAIAVADGEVTASDVAGPESAAAEEDLAPYLGTYIANFFQFRDARFEVVQRGEYLAIDVPGQMVFELLEPDAEGKRAFALVPGEIQVAFERDAAGAVVLLRMFQSGLVFELPREGVTFPIEVPLEELAPYLGAYQEVDGKTLQIVVQNQHLALDYPGQTIYELRPPDAAGRWAFRMTPDMGLEFHLGEDGKAASLTFHERGTERVCPRVDLPGVETLPTLEEVLRLRNAQEFDTRLAALGGCRMRGSVRFVHAGAEGSALSLFRAPDRQRDEIDLGPFGSHVTAVAGERAAMRSSFQPFEELTGAFLDEQRLAHPAALFGDWRAHFDSVQVIRTALELGRRQHVVELEKRGLPPQFAYVDFETGDLVKLEGRVLARGMPSLPRTTRFEDWRDVGGLRLPFRMVTEDEASGRIVIQMESFESGLELPDEAFVLAPE